MASTQHEFAVWTESAFRREVESWIAEEATAAGRRIIAPVEQPHVRGWGTVFCVPTDAGTLWCKASIPQLAYEVPLVETLSARRRESLPAVVAADQRRGWLLLEDAGVQVSTLVEHKQSTRHWEQLLPMYAQLQIDAAADTQALLAAGVPDRTLRASIEAYEDVLDGGFYNEHFSADELTRLHALPPRLRVLADVVQSLDMPDTVHHDDLHAWNVFLRDGTYVFIDWGDACISCPLLSIRIPLAHTAADFEHDARALERVRDAYLEPWTLSRAQLIAACDAAVVFAELTGVLKWVLINEGLDDEARSAYASTVPSRLRSLLEAACG